MTLREMRVEHLSSEAQQRRWETTKYAIEPAFGALFASDEVPPAEIVFAILDLFNRRAEPDFKAVKSFIAESSSTEMQTSKPVRGAMFNSFPHEKIIRAQLLERTI